MKTATVLILVMAAALLYGVTAASATEAAEQPEAATVEAGGGPRQRWDCVAFVADGDIYVVNLDGTGLTRLSADAADYAPTISPDGTKIAYVNVDKDRIYWAVYVMNADGSDKRRLSPAKEVMVEKNNVGDGWPVFAPDGERVVATRAYHPPCSVVIFPLTGGAEEFFRPPGLPPWDGGDPTSATFSPDGRKIAFYVETADCTQALWTANADGSGARPLVEENLFSFTLSPDWEKVAYEASADNGWQIYVINADGTGRRQLTRGDTNSYSPAFSPDGKKIIYISNWDIYVINPDGTGRRQITGGDSSNWDIYVINPDGTERRQITGGDSCNFSPAFSPGGKKIIYRSGWDICVINEDGSGRRFLAKGGDFSIGPSLVEGRLLDSYGNWHDVVEEPEATAPGE